MDDDLIAKLESFSGDDETYSVYKDPDLGLVIY
jgi:hypothetical protein